MRLRAITWLALLIIAAPAPSAAQSRTAAEYMAAIEGAQSSAGEDGLGALTVDELMERFKVPGFSVAVIHNFEIHWARGYGIADVETGAPVDVETLFQAASISKPVAAMGVLRAVQDGLFALDDDINDILESWTLDGGEFTRGRPVTPRMLTSHTSGLGDGFGFPGYDPAAPVPTVVQILEGHEHVERGRPVHGATAHVADGVLGRWRHAHAAGVERCPGPTLRRDHARRRDAPDRHGPQFLRTAHLPGVGSQRCTSSLPRGPVHGREVACVPGDGRGRAVDHAERSCALRHRSPTVRHWSIESGALPDHGPGDAFARRLPQAAEGQTITVWLRDKTNKKTASSNTVAVGVNAIPVSITAGMNTVATGVNGEVTGDLMRMAKLYVKKNSAFRNVFTPNATVNAASTSYVDATDVGLDSNYFPTIFPSGGSYIGTDYPFYYFSETAEGLPAALHGVYDVEFTPGMRWTLTSANGAMVRSNYNEAAGTATLTCNGNTGAATEIKFDGYDNGGGYVARTLPTAGNGYFRAIKQGQPAGKAFQAAVGTSLGGLTSTGGYTRFMGANNTNKEAIANVTYGTKTTRRPATATGILSQGETMSIEDMIEIAEDAGTNPWICIHDTADSAYVLDVAQCLYDNMPAGMKVAIEYSNEMWNFGAAFGQSTDLTSRATAAGVTAVVQYSREFKTKVLDHFETVFGVDSPRVHPVLCWQSSINSSQLASMLDEGNIYQKIKGFGIGPYVGGGIGTGADQGDYNNVTIFTKANRDLILTDAAAFKTAFFAATTVMSGLSQGVWLGFVNMLAAYCVSKGLSRTAIRPAAYEYMWQHIVERNTPTAASQDVLTKQAFAEILRDSRAGDQQDAQNNWLKLTGGDVVGFSHLANPGTSIPASGSWGYYNNISDTTSEPGVSTVAWVTANT